MSPIVILAGARTPIGRLQGGLKSVSATDLGANAIKAACNRAGGAAHHVCDKGCFLRLLPFCGQKQQKQGQQRKKEPVHRLASPRRG